MTKWIKPSGIEIILNDREETEEKARSLGWRKEGEKAPDAVTKEDLERYAKDKFGVDLDKRKSLENLMAEVKALENGNSQ